MKFNIKLLFVFSTLLIGKSIFAAGGKKSVYDILWDEAYGAKAKDAALAIYPHISASSKDRADDIGDWADHFGITVADFPPHIEDLKGNPKALTAATKNVVKKHRKLLEDEAGIPKAIIDTCCK